MRATADQQAHLTTALTDIGDALDITGAAHVAAATRDPGNELWRTLGPPPATRGGLAAWCGIAERIEAWRDQHPDTRLPDHHAPGADDLADLRLRLHLADRRHGIAGLVKRAPAIIDRASQRDLSPPRAPLEDPAIRHQAVDAAHRALAVEQATRSVESSPFTGAAARLGKECVECDGAVEDLSEGLSTATRLPGGWSAVHSAWSDGANKPGGSARYAAMGASRSPAAAWATRRATLRVGLAALAIGALGAVVPLRRVAAVDPASAFRRTS